MKLEALITAALLGAGCWQGASTCENTTAGQYRTNGSKVERCECAETKEGQEICAFRYEWNVGEYCVRLSEDFRSYDLVKCPEERRSIRREM